MNKNKRIRSIEDLREVVTPESRVLTLFSGGLDSAYLLYLLSQQKCTNVTALSVDLGDDLDYEEIKNLAAKLGANSIIIDRKKEFVQNFIVPAIASKSIYFGVHPISSSLSRPLIAKEAVDLAGQLNCDVILHTANQSQNSLRRLNGAIEQLDFNGYYGTPYEFSALTRKEKAQNLYKFGIESFNKRNYSGDSNLWCREFESGMLDDPEDFRTPETLYRWSSSQSTKESSQISITFEGGIPTYVNGTKMPLLQMIEFLNSNVGAYGLGRFTGLEHLAGGEKVLEVREMPAAHILLDAYRHLETACIGAETIREKLSVEQIWVREAIEGRWFETLKEAAEMFILNVSKKVSGTITYRLDWRTLEVKSYRANKPIYIRDRDNWEKEEANRQLIKIPSLA